MTESAPLAFRRLHPVSLLYAWGRGIRQVGALLILPALATDAGREASGGVSRVALAALVTALVTAVGAIADYVTRQFALGPETLVIRSGVLRRATRSIPYARIQGASTLQSLSQRWLGVGILRIDTGAGGRVAEAELSVLRWRDVEALRDEIMRRRRPATESAHASTPGDAGQTIPRPDAAPTSPPANAAETLATVPDAQLLLAGATSLQLLAVLASLVGLVDRLGARERVATIVPLIADLATLVSTNRGFGSLLTILVVGAILAGLALVWLAGVALTWARYRGFRLMRSGTALVREYGWLERRTATTPFMRMQGVVVRESPLRRLAGRAEVGLVSAGTMGVSESGQAPDVPMLLPIVRDSEVGGAVSLVYPDARIDGASTSPVPDWRRVSRRTWLRTGLVWTLRLTLILPVAALLLGTGVWHLYWILPVLWLCTPLASRVRGVGWHGPYVVVREGGLARDTWVLPVAKIQTVQWRQGPLQRRLGTATLRVTTAGSGGVADVVDLPVDEATTLAEQLAARLRSAAQRPAPLRAVAGDRATGPASVPA